jgi:hypothetical protein
MDRRCDARCRRRRGSDWGAELMRRAPPAHAAAARRSQNRRRRTVGPRHVARPPRALALLPRIPGRGHLGTQSVCGVSSRGGWADARVGSTCHASGPRQEACGMNLDRAVIWLAVIDCLLFWATVIHLVTP